MRAPCGWLPVHAGFLSHSRAVWVRCEGTWWLVSCVMKTQWKLVPSHMATLTLQVLFGRPVMWNYFRTQVINRGRLRLVAPSNNQPFRRCHCLIPLNCIFSLSLLFLALSVSSAFSPCCSLSLIFFSFSSTVHTFPEHLFPLDLRQLNIATGEDSSAS